MDGRGRIAQSLNLIARLRSRAPDEGGAAPRALRMPPMAMDSRMPWLLHRGWARLLRIKVPRGAGVAAAIVLLLGALGYGVVKGERLPAIVEVLNDVRDQAANAVGFRIADLTVGGYRHLSRDEVLATAGITGRSSLLFLDVDAARER